MTSVPCVCNGCGVEFPSKNSIFRHLNETAGLCLPEGEREQFLKHVYRGEKREKVILLYGYWIPSINKGQSCIHNGEDAAQFLINILEDDASNGNPRANVFAPSATTLPDNNKSNTQQPQKVNRSYGNASRGGMDIVQQEDGTSAVTEVLATKLPKILGSSHVVQEWISRINELLEKRLGMSNDHAMIRLLGRQSMPLSKFNAEMDVSHRRIEYLLPVDFLMTEMHDSYFFDTLPSFVDVLVQHHNERNHHHNGSSSSVLDAPATQLTESTRPNGAALDFLTELKKIMKGLTTQIEELDTNDTAAVLEKEFHKQKRQRNREYQNNKSNNTTNNMNHNENNAENKDTDEGSLCSVHSSNDDNTMKQDDDKNINPPLNHGPKSKSGRSRGQWERQREQQSKKKRAILKNPDKKEGILRRKRYHNFTATVVAHDFLSYRRLDRLFHRATLRYADPCVKDNAMNTIQTRHHCDNHKDTRSTMRTFLVICLSGDMFLHGQVSYLIGLLIALVRKDIDPDFVDCVFDENFPHLVPTPPAPMHAMYAGDVFYVSMEGKVKAILTPRDTDRYDKGWNDTQTIQHVRDFQSMIRQNIARTWLEDGIDSNGHLIAEMEWNKNVLQPWAVQARKQLEHYRQWKEDQRVSNTAIVVTKNEDDFANSLESPAHVFPKGVSPSIPALVDVVSTVPTIYEKALYYLRQADASGRWPSTSAKRQLVMVSNANVNSKSDIAQTELPTSLSMARSIAKANKPLPQVSPYAFLEGQGGASGSFSVGAMPGIGCEQPKGNVLFPELMKAAFELEMALCPNREPSSTIAVNRNAQFRPHTDSGAGAGQSTSLIVGLGTYSGGELIVEGESKDIRYQPIEFNGWKQRHWTMPFVGERFSLVWFTPKGCEGIHGIDLCT